MKILRIVATVVIGGYLLAMGLQLVGVSLTLLRDTAGIGADAANAQRAFFPNLLVCVLCSAALWAMWRSKRVALA